MRDHLGAWRDLRLGCARAGAGGCAGAGGGRRSVIQRFGSAVPGSPPLRRTLRCASADRRSVASSSLGVDDGDRRVDLYVLGAGGNEDLGKLALVDRLDLHRRLVGLDLGDDVAGLDLLAHLHQPLGERALLHGGRQRGHQDLRRHRFLPRAAQPAMTTSV